MDRIQTPTARALFTPIRPVVNQEKYPSCPSEPLVIFKMAQQFVFDSGFDSTNRLQKAPKEMQEKVKSEQSEFIKRVKDLTFALEQKCTLDVKFGESLCLTYDPMTSMDDAMYTQLHVVMECFEQLADHNEVTVEYPIYDNVKKYGLDVSLEDQPVNTFSPIQTYLAPIDARINCQYIAARMSSHDYDFPESPGMLQACFFIPKYDAVSEPSLAQKTYVNTVLLTSGELIPQDFISRQPSAHELWVRLVAQRQRINSPADIAEAYQQIIENEPELLDALNSLQSTEPEDIEAKIVCKQKNVENPFNAFVETIVEQCISSCSTVFDTQPLTLVTQRSYMFPTDFDATIRGMIEQKATVHNFYSLEPAKKRAFMRAIIASKLLQYHQYGSFAQFLNSDVVIPMERDEYAAKDEKQSKTEFQRQMTALTDEFCDIILKQHQELLRAMLQSHQAHYYVETQLSGAEGKLKTMLLRPVCGCYTCNLCSLSEYFEFTPRIFPLIRLTSNKEVQLNVGETKFDYYVSPSEVLDKTFGLEHTADFMRLFPYFKQLNESVKNEGITVGIFEEEKVERSKKVPKVRPPKKHKPEQLLDAIMLYANCIPSFLQYPATYGPPSAEFPAIVLSQQFRPGRTFCAKSEVLLAFVQNPQLAVAQPEEDEEEQALEKDQNVFRTTALTKNAVLQRHLLQHYRVPYVEPPHKAIADWTATEIAHMMYQRDEINGDLFTSDLNLCSDFRSIQGLQILVRNVPSLPTAKKYRGQVPGGAQRGKKPFAVFRCKTLSKKLGMSDQKLISKLYYCWGEGKDERCANAIEFTGSADTEVADSSSVAESMEEYVLEEEEEDED